MAKGQKFGGREKGVPNKSTYYVREAFKELVEGEVENFRSRLRGLSDKDYFNVILKMAEFFTPKYQSVAVSVGEEKNDLLATLIALRDETTSDRGE